MRHAIAFLFVVTWTLGRSAGYDYASACARPKRAARGRLQDAPCDLTKTNYCTTPGNSYPWHAIRRFVRENQGLMKRMYGEERHLSVLKAELENFIEEDDEDADMKTDFVENLIKAKLKYTNKSHGRAMKNKPHFRPIQSDRKKTDNDTLKVKPIENTKTRPIIEKENKTEITNNETLNDDKGISYKTKLASIANIEINNLDPDVITLEAVIKQSIETNSIYPFSGSPKSDILNSEAKANSSDKSEEKNDTTSTEIPNATDTTTVDEPNDTTTDSTKDDWKPMNVEPSTLAPTLLFSEHDKLKNEEVDKVTTTEKKEEFHLKPNQHQEPPRPSVIKLRGANACETKEELAAPFWANSTRGEVLALLNMYPFEQYIHSEKCVHERKQMYCREGCRCEQEYRFHRLLAYDPRNECRGIFADWFKFPACCVCKCYDVPLEFRARSPRILHPEYDEDVKRVIYEDVARDWYSTTYDDEMDDLY